MEFDGPAHYLMDEDEWINDTGRLAGFPCECGHPPHGAAPDPPGCPECPCPQYRVGEDPDG